MQFEARAPGAGPSPCVNIDSRMGSGLSVFSHFLATEPHRTRADSLSEAMGVLTPIAMRQPQAQQ